MLREVCLKESVEKPNELIYYAIDFWSRLKHYKQDNLIRTSRKELFQRKFAFYLVNLWKFLKLIPIALIPFLRRI